MKIKIFSISILLILLTLISTTVFASTSDVTMEVLTEPIATIDIGEKSKLEKSLVAKDLSNKEVTIQLKVTNNEESSKPTGEIEFVIDNSSSMITDKVSDGRTRFEAIQSSAKSLISSLLKDNNQLKIGITSFSSGTLDDLGTEKDATVVSALTDNKSELLNAVDNIPTYDVETSSGTQFLYTDLDAGLTLGNKQFSSTSTNKYMIVLSDGVPNLVLGDSEVKYVPSTYSKSKEKLQQVSNSGVKVISLLTGVDLDKQNPTADPVMTYGEIVQAVFGTEEAPTTGVFHNIADDDIEKTITETIYKDLVGTEKTLKDITVTDYFPQEIVSNFDFAYIKEANIGSISAEIDKNSNSITWNIPELKVGETALVQYTLKLKDDFDTSILNKILNTNTEIDIDYTDPDGNSQSAQSTVSPTLKLSKKDDSTAPVIIPRAGTPMFITLGIILGGITIFSAVKYFKIKF